MSLLSKGDVVINPETNNPIRVGGVTWLKLVKRGLIKGEYRDPRRVAVIDDKQNIEQQKKELLKQLPSHLTVARGRGRFANHIVTRTKKPTIDEMSKLAAQTAAAIVHDNLEDLADADDLEGQLEKMIIGQMSSTWVNKLPDPKAEQKPEQPKRAPGRPKKQRAYKTKKPAKFDDTTDVNESEYDDPAELEPTTTDAEYFTS